MALQGPIDQSALQKRRLQAVRLFEKGIAPSEAARRLGVARQSAGRWREERPAGGDKALKSEGRIGRRRALSRPNNRSTVSRLSLLPVSKTSTFLVPAGSIPTAATTQITRVSHTPSPTSATTCANLPRWPEAASCTGSLTSPSSSCRTRGRRTACLPSGP
jgi:hypothetical protein